jgi:hypothetical protein
MSYCLLTLLLVLAKFKKLVIDSKDNSSSTLAFVLEPNTQNIHIRIMHNISQNQNDPTVRSP